MEKPDLLCVINKVQSKHPDLSQFGFGGKGDMNPDAVGLCIEWLFHHDAIDRRKTVNPKISSYAWKHIVERHYKTYVANGEFICAALYLGYKMRKRGPNAWFNIRNPKE